MMYPLNPAGYQQLLVSNVAVGLTRPPSAHRALIGVSGGAIRWLARPSDQLSSRYGNFVGAGGTIPWTQGDIDYAAMLDKVKFIKAGANDATLEINYFW